MPKWTAVLLDTDLIQRVTIFTSSFSAGARGHYRIITKKTERESAPGFALMSRTASMQSARMKYDHVAWLNRKGNQIKITPPRLYVWQQRVSRIIV